jgi:outer membrane protein insertion porin family
MISTTVLLFASTPTRAQNLPVVPNPKSLSQDQVSHDQDPNHQIPKTAPQVEETLSSYEGQRVVAVELAGRPNLDETRLQPLLLQKKGEPFSKARVNQSVAALKSSGEVGEVELEIRPQADGVRVMFVLQPAIYFGIYTFPGAQRFAYSRLLQVADYPPRGAYSAIDVANTTDRLTRFFQQNGYFQAQVHAELQMDSAHGLVNVKFQVALKRHARFGKIVFQGAPVELEPQLQHALKAMRARLREVAIREGRSYSLKTVQRSIPYLESKLVDEDYFGGRVELAGAEYDPSTNRADVHFNVTPGQRAHVTIQGARVWSWTRRKLLPIYEEAELDSETIQEGRENLVAYFQSKGYFDVKVVAETRSEKAIEDIVYRVTEGPRRKVRSVEIVGNRNLPTSSLRADIKVEKAESAVPFSHGKFSDQLLRQSVNNLEKVYQAEGFSSVKITPEITKPDGNIAVKFHIEEGPQDLVQALRLEGNVTVPVKQLAPKGLNVVEGKAYSAKKVDQDRNQIVAQYLRMGYLSATFRATAGKTKNAPHRVEVIYQISEGPRVVTNTIATLGARNTRQSLIDQTVRMKPGTPLREDEMFTAESLLYTLGIFDWAEIDPRRAITTQDKEDVLVKVHESSRNELQYGFGFEVINRGGSIPSGTVAVPGLPPVGLPSTFQTSEKTFWGPRGTFQYTRRNLRGLGESVTVGVLGARLVQRVGISYNDPHFVGSNWSSTLTSSAERNSENPIFTSRFADGGFQVQKQLNAARTKTLSFRYDYRETSLADLLIPDLVPTEDLRLHLSTLAASYSYDTRDNPLDAARGIYETADFDITAHAIGSSVSFARLRTQIAHYKNVGAGIIWANSLRVGLAAPFSASRVPVSELFFSGGGSTLRGFPLNAAGAQRSIPVCGNPNDASTCTQIQVPDGGRQLLIINSEFRFPLPIRKGLGFAAFYDGGNVFQAIGFHDFGANYSNTVGVGLRYKTPLGPVRLDLGYNLNAPPGIKSTRYFVTLGQAF